jgi:hypothetical protein
MRIYGIIAAGTIGLTIAGPALAQGQQFETPLYTTGNQSSLDRNYGLPSFGMPGSELPVQRTTAPEPVTAEKPDFFRESSDLSVAKKRTAGSAETETPLYTTSDGSTGSGDTFGTTPTTMETETTR